VFGRDRDVGDSGHLTQAFQVVDDGLDGSRQDVRRAIEVGWIEVLRTISRSPASSRTRDAFSASASMVHVAGSPFVSKLTMSASRAANERIRGPLPPTTIGGCGRWTGFGRPTSPSSG
jgi:hypothetical protein